MVQNYIKRMNNRGALITCSVANAAPKALIRKCLSVIDVIDVGFSSWAQGLFCWMGFSRRQKFSVKVDIPATARKEIEYLFLYEIVLRVEQYAIADLLIINFDQTPLKLVQCANSTLVKKKPKKTRTFAITLAGEFLPIQLSYGGKTTQRLPRYQFPEVFSLSVNEKHLSNSKETVKSLNVIIAPYVRKMPKS